jgi:hypothetical protein
MDPIIGQPGRKSKMLRKKTVRNRGRDLSLQKESGQEKKEIAFFGSRIYNGSDRREVLPHHGNAD